MGLRGLDGDNENVQSASKLRNGKRTGRGTRSTSAFDRRVKCCTSRVKLVVPLYLEAI